jgi:hypothetical protein
VKPWPLRRFFANELKSERGETAMKYTTKALFSVAVALALTTLFVQQARAFITLNGVVHSGGTGLVILQAHTLSAGSGILKFKFSAPTFNAGTPYVLDFCIGPAANPCQSATASYIVHVPVGEERLGVVDANVFANNVLVVATGTVKPVPFSVMIE